MMYIISLLPTPDTPNNPTSSSLIVFNPLTPRLRFLVVYAPHFTADGFKFKLISRQIGVDGQKIAGTSLIDFVIDDISTGDTITHVASFFKKLILMECGLQYSYQNCSMVSDDSIKIAKWASWFSDVTKIIPFNSRCLDILIAQTVSTQNDYYQNGKVAIPAGHSRVVLPPVTTLLKRQMEYGLLEGCESKAAKYDHPIPAIPGSAQFTEYSDPISLPEKIDPYNQFNRSNHSNDPTSPPDLPNLPDLPKLPDMPKLPDLPNLPKLPVPTIPEKFASFTYDRIFSTVSIKGFTVGGGSFRASLSSGVTLNPVVGGLVDRTDTETAGLPFLNNSFGNQLGIDADEWDAL